MALDAIEILVALAEELRQQRVVVELHLYAAVGGVVARCRHLRRLRCELAGEAVGERRREPHRRQRADEPVGRLRMHRLEIGGAPDKLARMAPRLLEQHVERAADRGGVEGPLLLGEQRLQLRQPRGPSPRPAPGPAWRRRRARPRAVFEREGLREADLAHERQRRGEIGVALAGKADDEVGGEARCRAAPGATARRRDDNRRRRGGGSSPRARGPIPTAPAGAGRASAAARRDARRSARRRCRADARWCSGCAGAPRSRPAPG